MLSYIDFCHRKTVAVCKYVVPYVHSIVFISLMLLILGNFSTPDKVIFWLAVYGILPLVSILLTNLNDDLSQKC